MAVTEEAVLTTLASVTAPRGLGPLPMCGRLSAIVVREGRVHFSISVEPTEARAWEATRQAAERTVAALPGVASVMVALTADRVPQTQTQSRTPDSSPLVMATTAAVPRPVANANPISGAHSLDIAATAPKPPPVFPNLAKVGKVIAVASGKGGVGKSTTACNLALALSAPARGQRALRVGVLDADIYGPSMPKLFALRGEPRILDGRTLSPLEGYGIKVMSIGFLVDPAKAMIWRGPMVASAITQMLRDVAWGELDVLVVDMPPGTGDAQLSLAQQAPLAGAVIVSTPQDLALIDARRGVAMFRDVGVPILGLVENMSYFICDDCTKRHYIFGQGGAKAEAQKLDVPFLGEVPLEPAIRERSDAGLPIVVAEPDSTGARAYRGIAETLRKTLRLA